MPVLGHGVYGTQNRAKVLCQGKASTPHKIKTGTPEVRVPAAKRVVRQKGKGVRPLLWISVYGKLH